MIDYAYEDLETEAAREEQEQAQYEAKCYEDELAREDEQNKLNAKAVHPQSFEPTPTKAQKIIRVAETTLEGLEDGRGPHVHLREFALAVIALAKAIDER